MCSLRYVCVCIINKMQWLSKHLDPYIYRKIQYKDKKTRGKAGRGRVAKIFVIRMDSIRSEYIWETPQLESFGDKETRVKWFGHAQKRDSEYGLVWTCARAVNYGGVRQEEKKKATEEFYGCSGGGHADCCPDRKLCQEQGEIEADDPIWSPMMWAT